MNSEELEQSLRMEFETYLNSVLAEMRKESEEFQNKIEAEFDRQRTQFSEAFRTFATRFDAAPRFDEAFTGSLSEHLRLARDEGAKIAATAMAEAEKLDDKPAAAKYDTIRDAVNDISSKDSQSAILKSLVQHAEEFAPRGAFFIIKNENFAGWKVFGADDNAERTVREIHFPSSNDTILAKAVSSLATVESSAGEHSGDDAFLRPLGFENPGRMMALPLVARGRGVAVLFVDEAGADGEINREALETLVRVAGLTVELLASMQTAHEENRTVAPADFEDARHEHEEQPYAEAFQPTAEPAPAASSGFAFGEGSPYDTAPPEIPQSSGFVAPAPEYGAQPEQSFESHFDSEQQDIGGRRQTATPFTPEPESSSPFSAGTESYSSFAQEPESYSSYTPEPETTSSFAPEPEYESPAVVEAYPEPEATHDFQAPIAETTPQAPVEQQMDHGFAMPEAAERHTQSTPFDSGYGQPAEQQTQSAPFETGYGQPADFGDVAPNYPAAEEKSAGFAFEPQQAEPAAVGASPFDRAVEDYSPAPAAFERTPEPVVPAPVATAPAAPAPGGRLSDRNVDLPIDVPEEERRLHNDARRFARLLVSEIKLYNEKKVAEGREANDLYERLREAIDRSREMYDKRVQPPVASKFDYFHYELTNSLAEGNVERLGAGYPGASV